MTKFTLFQKNPCSSGDNSDLILLCSIRENVGLIYVNNALEKSVKIFNPPETNAIVEWATEPPVSWLECRAINKTDDSFLPLSISDKNVSPTNMDGGDLDLIWSDNRYRIFCAFPIAVIAAVAMFLLGLATESLADLSLPVPALASVVMSVVYTPLEPRFNRSAKVWLTKKIISPPVPLFSTSDDFKWESQRHVITIEDVSGTCNITKEMVIKNVGDTRAILSHPHNFQFSSGKIEDIYEHNGTQHPVKCSLSNGNTVDLDYLIREDGHVEFLTEFQTPIGSSETYEIELGRVEGAFPLEDQQDSWSVRLYSECEELEICVTWNYDIRITHARGENMLTGESLDDIQVDNGTNQITVKAEDLSAGYYQIIWEKESKATAFDH